MITSKDILGNTKALNLFALKLCKGNRNEAEDLLHTTIVRALEKQHLFETGTNFFKWASKIMFNIFATQYRHHVRYDTQFDPEPYLLSEAVEADQETLTDWHKIERTMFELPNHHREIITMICINGLSYQEAADELSIEMGTVRSRLSRAKENLQDLLKTCAANGSITNQRAAA